MKKNYFKSGSWNVTCDICSKKIKAEDSRLNWQGFVVCEDDWEPRHPQDFVQAKTDKITVPFTRPPSQDVFTEVLYITHYVSDSYVDDDYFIIEEI